MSVLYRKYRPMTFGEVADQKHITQTIANEIVKKALAHAYLFIGPRGTGKTSLARILARSLNCAKRAENDPEPCNTCKVCTQILKESYLDVAEIDAATHTQVDNVREVIISSTRIPPLRQGGYKIYIVDEVHMLSKHAFNALLKTLEEPPPNVIFILATTAADKVPDTIKSRCERYDFKLLSFESIVGRLQMISERENVAVPVELITSIARNARGSMRDAESLLTQVISVADKGTVNAVLANAIVPRSLWTEALRVIDFLRQDDAAGALGYINELVSEGINPNRLFSDAVECTRLMLLARVIPGLVIPVDEGSANEIRRIGSAFDLTDLQRLLQVLNHDATCTTSLTIPQLPLELACLTYCQHTIPSSADNVKKLKVSSEPKTSPTSSHTNSSDITKLLSEWNNILIQLKDRNHSLAAFLKKGHPLSLSEGTLTLGFRYDFHAETVRENKNRAATESTVSSVLGSHIKVDCVVDPDYTDNHKKFSQLADQDLHDIIETVGGGEEVM